MKKILGFQLLLLAGVLGAQTIRGEDHKLSITTDTLPNGTVNVSYSLTFSATGGQPPYFWGLVFGFGSPPPGLSFSSAGVLSGTPTAAGTFKFVVGVLDQGHNAATKSFHLKISSGPAELAITTTSPLPNGAVGSPYSQTLTATGGSPPYSWSVSSGTLPAGLNLDSASGAISGTPNTAGAFQFTVKVTDSSSASADKSLSLTIGAQPVAITSSPVLPDAVAGSKYSQQLTASGGSPPYIWSIGSGALPTGLTLNSSNGVISGLAGMPGTFLFVVQVHDSASGSATQNASITVHQPALSITSASVRNGEVGAAYSMILTASGGAAPYQWSISGGALPPGLTLDSSAGTISGTPAAPGTVNFTVHVSDSAAQTANGAFQIVVAQRVSVLAATLPAASIGTAYSTLLAVSGGVPPYAWIISTGSLPPGLLLDAGTGVISGLPTSAGNFSFGVQVRDSLGVLSTRQLSIIVDSSGGMTIGTTSLPIATVGANYVQTLTVSGGSSPYTWSTTAGNLPPGLTLSSSGSISGAPSSTGTFNFTVQAQDAAAHMATQQLSITVASGLTISTSELPGATVNTSYSQMLSAAGGSLPYSWSVSAGSLPTGLLLAPSTGVLSGTPTAAGVYNFTVRLTDGTSTTTIHTFSISVTAGSSGMPQAVINGLTDTASAAQQLPIDVQLATVYSSNVSGTITATFEPDAAAPADDPAIQFTTGGRFANFSIPANTQHAVFAVSQMALQTGTVAGTISLDITLQSPNGASTTLARSIRIARAAPVIRNVAVVKNANGFEIHITGLATSREVTEAELQFQPAAGSSVQTSSLTVNLSDAAKQWYQSASSGPFGSQFFLILPFNVQGGVNQIGGATVSLKNSVGISPVASATF